MTCFFQVGFSIPDDLPDGQAGGHEVRLAVTVDVNGLQPVAVRQVGSIDNGLELRALGSRSTCLEGYHGCRRPARRAHRLITAIPGFSRERPSKSIRAGTLARARCKGSSHRGSSTAPRCGLSGKSIRRPSPPGAPKVSDRLSSRSKRWGDLEHLVARAQTFPSTGVGSLPGTTHRVVSASADRGLLVLIEDYGVFLLGPPVSGQLKPGWNPTSAGIGSSFGFSTVIVTSNPSSDGRTRRPARRRTGNGWASPRRPATRRSA